MRNSKPLFLINDQQAKIFKLYIFGKNSVRSNDHIYLTFFQIFDCLLLLCRSPESAQQFHTHRKFLHPLDKGIINLLCKDCGRCKISYLSALLHFLKRSTQSHFCFAIAHISTDKPVHNLSAFHITFGILNGTELILSFFIWKHLFKFLLPYSIRTTDISFLFLTNRIKLYQLLRNILNCTSNLALCFIPLLSAKFIQFRSLCRICTRIFLQTVKLCGKNIEVASTSVFNLNIIFDNSVYFNFLNPAINTKTMLLMNNKITNGKLSKILNTVSAVIFFLLFLLLFLSKDVRFCHYRKLDQRIFKALLCMAINHHDLARTDFPVIILAIKGCQSLFLKILCQPLGSCAGTGKQCDPVSLFLVLMKVFYQKFKTIVISID